MNAIAQGISRRGFMTSAAGFTFAVVTANDASAVMWEKQVTGDKVLNPWVSIATDGTVSIMSPCHEMGQGSWTSIPAILADELDADWKKVSLVRCPPDDATYGAPLGSRNAVLITRGSNAVSNYFAPMRKFGGQVRKVLMDNAAKHWNVPVEELSTEPHVVVHKASGRKLGYGEIAKFMEVPEKAPEISDAELKKPSQWRYIGHDLMRVDVPSKVNGTTLYGIDVMLPNMVYAAITRAPVQDSVPDEVDSTATKAIEGVIDVIRMPAGVAVVAETPWAAFAGKDALNVTWSRTGRGWGFNSETAHADYLKSVRDLTTESAESSSKGDVNAALKEAVEVVESEYFCDFAYHAQMEPLNSVSDVAPDGQSAEIWAGTQGKSTTLRRVCEDLRLKVHKVKVHDLILGGGFGRRAGLDMEYVMDSALLSRDLKRPVKAMWTREEDIRNGRFHPLSAHYMRAGLDKDGKVIAWHHRKAADEPLSFYDAGRYMATTNPDGISFGGMELESYDIPNYQNEAVAQKSGIRVCALRAIGYTANKSASEVFIDELAHKKGVDPIEYRIELLKDTPDAVKVMKTVAEMSRWNEKRGENIGLGVSFVDYRTTWIAMVAEVKVDRSTGDVTPLNVWMAVDPGIAVQPDNCVAQLEGSAVWGLGLALWERITVTDGVVDQTNFYDYFVPRMNQMPLLHVNLMPSGRMKPSGIGQMTTPGMPAAVSNAIFNAVGVRVNHQPFTPERVLAALNRA